MMAVKRSQQCRGETLQSKDNEENEQQKKQTARRGWEDFGLQKALDPGGRFIFKVGEK